MSKMERLRQDRLQDRVPHLAVVRATARPSTEGAPPYQPRPSAWVSRGKDHLGGL
jgi:hypothetical protein